MLSGSSIKSCLDQVRSDLERSTVDDAVVRQGSVLRNLYGIVTLSDADATTLARLTDTRESCVAFFRDLERGRSRICHRKAALIAVDLLEVTLLPDGR